MLGSRDQILTNQFLAHHGTKNPSLSIFGRILRQSILNLNLLTQSLFIHNIRAVFTPGYFRIMNTDRFWVVWFDVCK